MLIGFCSNRKHNALPAELQKLEEQTVFSQRQTARFKLNSKYRDANQCRCFSFSDSHPVGFFAPWKKVNGWGRSSCVGEPKLINAFAKCVGAYAVVYGGTH